MRFITESSPCQESIMRRLLTALTLTSLATIVIPASAEWTYRSFKMGIDEEIAQTATTQSLNSLSLDFPYRGENHGQLILRTRPDTGFDLMISIDKGQILCGISSCYLKVKFDANPSYEAKFSPSQSHDSSIVFADNPEALEKEIRKGKRMKIELPLYRSASQVLEFNITGLNYKKINRIRPDDSSKVDAQTIEPNVPASPTLSAPTPPLRNTPEVAVIRTPPIAANSNTAAGYPIMSLRFREQGTVKVRFLIKNNGSVSNVEVKSSSGYPRLDNAAVDTVRTWSFTPATEDGKPVDIWYQTELTFKLND